MVYFRPVKSFYFYFFNGKKLVSSRKGFEQRLCRCPSVAFRVCVVDRADQLLCAFLNKRAPPWSAAPRGAWLTAASPRRKSLFQLSLKSRGGWLSFKSRGRVSLAERAASRRPALAYTFLKHIHSFRFYPIWWAQPTLRSFLPTIFIRTFNPLPPSDVVQK